MLYGHRIYLLVVGVSPSSVHSYLSPVLNSLSIITGFLSPQELWTLLFFAFLTGGPELHVVSKVLKNRIKCYCPLEYFTRLVLEYPPTNWKNRHIPKIWATFLLRRTSFVSRDDGRIHYLLFSLKSICKICSYVRFCRCIDFIRGKVNERECAGIWILLAQNVTELKLYISLTDITY